MASRAMVRIVAATVQAPCCCAPRMSSMTQVVSPDLHVNDLSLAVTESTQYPATQTRRLSVGPSGPHGEPSSASLDHSWEQVVVSDFVLHCSREHNLVLGQDRAELSTRICDFVSVATPGTFTDMHCPSLDRAHAPR